jgi:hypothetical protein
VSLVRGAEKILCPREIGPITAPEHQLHTRMLNAAYDTAERTPDGEMTEAADRQYHALKVNEGMRSYVATTEGMADGFGVVTVRAAWFHCRICGLVLPGEYRTAQEEWR